LEQVTGTGKLELETGAQELELELEQVWKTGSNCALSLPKLGLLYSSFTSSCIVIG
jgi:hypothetical protein